MTNDELEQYIYSRTRQFVGAHVLEVVNELLAKTAALATPAPLSDEPVAVKCETCGAVGTITNTGSRCTQCGMRNATPSDKQESVTKDARQRFIDRDPVQVSERTRELARQALATRDNDTRTDEEIAEAGAAFICDTRFDAPVIAAPPAQSAEQDRIDAERCDEILRLCRLFLDDEKEKYNARSIVTQIFGVAVKGASK